MISVLGFDGGMTEMGTSGVYHNMALHAARNTNAKFSYLDREETQSGKMATFLGISFF